MKTLRTLQESLVKRLFFVFLILGLLPTLLLIAAPTVYVALHGTESVGKSLLLMWGAQGVTFLIIVLIGGSITLKRLALPIQDLVDATDTLAEGDLSYRVPIRSGEQELVSLARAFNRMADAIETMHIDIEQQRSTLQATLDEREQAFNAILQVTSLVNNEGDIRDIIERALRICHHAVGADTLALVGFDETGQISSSVAVCDQCPKRPGACDDQCERKQLLHDCFQAMHDNLFQEAIRRRGRISIQNACAEDAGLKPEVVETLCKLGARKFAVLPLIARNSAVGTIVLMRPEIIEIPIPTQSLVKALAENLTILIENHRLRSSSRALTIMEERRRLARELHDSVTQSLFTLSLTARGLKASFANVPGIDCRPFDVLVDQTKVIQTDMRKLINEFRPVDLDTYDLEEALQQHAQSLRRSSDVDVKLSIRGDVHRLSHPVQRHLNRIAQEALSNVARHAEARHGEIVLDISNQVVTLTIWDDGRGFDPRAVAHGQSSSLGLESMRERAEMLGGTLSIRSQPGEMTSLIVKVPLSAEESDA